jgi:predicted DNA-binding transcriptional regulator AlpA
MMEQRRPSEALMTAKDVAKRLQVSQRRVHQLRIPKIRLGTRTVRFRERDVQDLIDARATGA